MGHLFSYTECEAAGPFQQKPGFKIKSVSSLPGFAPPVDLEKLLNVTIASFPNFEPPKVDSYASRSDFEKLPKLWTFQRVADGHMAFIRLATSGTKMGRPGNPFHQAFVVKYQELRELFEAAESMMGLKNLTPADLYFWSWPSPRGDLEVETESYEQAELPVPRMSELDLSDLWDEGLNSESASEAISQFEAKWLSGVTQVAYTTEKDFFSLLSFLLRLIPLQYSWAYPFGNFLRRSESRVAEQISNGGIFLSAEPLEEKSEMSVFWADLVDLVVENGIQLDVIRGVQDLSELFDFSVQNQRQALAFLPLALLLLPDPNGFISDSGLRGVAWSVFKDVGVRMELRNKEAALLFSDNFLRNLDISEIPSEAEAWLRGLGAASN